MSNTFKIVLFLVVTIVVVCLTGMTVVGFIALWACSIDILAKLFITFMITLFLLAVLGTVTLSI